MAKLCLLLIAATCHIGTSDACVPLTPHTPGHVAEEDGQDSLSAPSYLAVTPAKAVLAFEAAADSAKGKLSCAPLCCCSESQCFLADKIIFRDHAAN